MCIAVPMKLTAMDGSTGFAESDGVTRIVNLMLIENPSVGDYLIVHAGCAISRIDESVALETLETLKRMYIKHQ